MTSTTNPIRPLGGQALPLRWAEARRLADLLSTPGTRVPANFTPLAAQAAIGPVPGVATSSFLDALPIATCYEAVSRALRGDMGRAEALAQRTRARGAAVIPDAIVDGVVAGLAPLRAMIESEVQRKTQHDSRFVAEDDPRQRMRVADARAVYRPVLAQLSPEAVREQLFSVVAVSLKKAQDVTAVRLVLHGIEGGLQAFMEAAGPFGYLATRRYDGMLDEIGRLSYPEWLFERGGVPLSLAGMEALPEAARAAWRADPSFMRDPSRGDQLFELSPPSSTDRIGEVEAAVDARLGTAQPAA